MNNTDDHIILKGILAGDPLVIKKFYKENLPYIRKYVIQNSGHEDDVADVFQDALIIIYEKLTNNDLEVSASLRSYFYGICKNIWRNRMRKNKKIVFNDSFIENSNDINNSIVKTIEYKDKAQVYQKYFSTLNNSCKEILELFFIGKSMREIAKIIGYTEGYTRKKKFECKKSLLEKIEKDPIYQELTEIYKK